MPALRVVNLLMAAQMSRDLFHPCVKEHQPECARRATTYGNAADESSRVW